MAFRAERARGDRVVDAAVELIRVGARRLREDDGELVAADAAGESAGAHGVAESVGGLGEDGVSREMADPVVDGLEVVEVEDESARWRS